MALAYRRKVRYQLCHPVSVNKHRPCLSPIRYERNISQVPCTSRWSMDSNKIVRTIFQARKHYRHSKLSLTLGNRIGTSKCSPTNSKWTSDWQTMIKEAANNCCDRAIRWVASSTATQETRWLGQVSKALPTSEVQALASNLLTAGNKCCSKTTKEWVWATTKTQTQALTYKSSRTRRTLLQWHHP